MITLDGGDRLSYAEFVVFVTDPHHAELQAKVCKQAAEQLEGLGRRSFNLDAAFQLQSSAAVAAAKTTAPDTIGDAVASSSGIGDGTWPETMTTASAAAAATVSVPQQQHALHGQRHIETTTPDRMVGLRQGMVGPSAATATATGEKEAMEDPQHGVSVSGGVSVSEKQVVSAEEFLAALRNLGLRLSVSDAHRLLLRFDVHGDGHISTRRFVSMVESSRPWTRALVWLAHQEEADEEADACLRAQRMSGAWPPAVQQRRDHGQGQGQGQDLVLSADIVEMARYIGIRVSSDSSLLWIAADALAAPLPNGWVMHKGKDGRWFYHNEITGTLAYLLAWFGVPFVVLAWHCAENSPPAVSSVRFGAAEGQLAETNTVPSIPAPVGNSHLFVVGDEILQCGSKCSHSRDELTPRVELKQTPRQEGDENTPS